MNSRSIILLVSCVPIVTATGLTGFVQDALPRSNSHFFVDAASAAPCQDGSVWIFWVQGGMADVASPNGQAAGPEEIGIFAELIGRDGATIIPPKRIMEGYPHRDEWRHGELMAPSSFAPIVARDGRAIVFVLNEEEANRKGLAKATSTVVVVDRKGGVGRQTLGASLWASWPGMYDDRASARIWSYEEENGVIVVIFGENRDVVRTELSIKGTKVEVRVLQRYKFWSDKTYRRLWWTGYGWDYSDIQPADSNLLLVAHVPPDQHLEDVVWGQPFAGDTMIVYRLRAQDLALVDSVRLVATSVAGSDYVGARIPRAVLQRLSNGFSFWVPRSYGTASFLLNEKGRPVLGERAKGAAQTDSVFDGTGPQLVSFSLPGWLYHLPEKVTWFGLTRSGVFCQDSSSRPWSEKSGLR